ncbi:hypothetical protein AVEN_229530-1 [Araneus ventricosus]|uniref:Uncharacterized protein n=1 Tax=Araneus ventricosus TaxID=182803 RepID=A0A4Y2EJA5_ARAVE|nr:hypothetical protein AVEN_229530-1 [Araneus ventricosus]
MRELDVRQSLFRFNLFPVVPQQFGYNPMKCRMSFLQIEIRLSYLKLALDRGPECVFGVTLRLAKPGSFLTRHKLYSLEHEKGKAKKSYGNEPNRLPWLEFRLG